MFFSTRFCYAFMPTSETPVGENNSGFRQHRLVSLIRGAYSHQVLSDSASPDPPSVKQYVALGLLFILAVERHFIGVSSER